MYLFINISFIKNEILIVRIENIQSNIECTISDLDQFSTELGLIRFQRKGGHVSGFELDSGRVKNLKFIMSLFSIIIISYNTKDEFIKTLNSFSIILFDF